MSIGVIRGLTSIIVPCWSQLAFTRQCVAALKEHTRPSWELIVVDNESTDGTGIYLEGARDMAAVPVTLISNATNLGFPAAINQGLQLARGEYLVLLNNDVVVTDGWLDQLIALASASPSRSELRDGSVLEAGDPRLSPFFDALMSCAETTPPPPVGRVLRCCAEFTPPGPPSQGGERNRRVRRVMEVGPTAWLDDRAGWAIACRTMRRHRNSLTVCRIATSQICISLPGVGAMSIAANGSPFPSCHWVLLAFEAAAVYEAVGGLDERFGLGFFDDDDLAERARRTGFELAVAHDLFVHHFGSRTFAGNGIDAGKLLDENARRFADKWGLERDRRVALRWKTVEAVH